MHWINLKREVFITRTYRIAKEAKMYSVIYYCPDTRN